MRRLPTLRGQSIALQQCTHISALCPQSLRPINCATTKCTLSALSYLLSAHNHCNSTALLAWKVCLVVSSVTLTILLPLASSRHLIPSIFNSRFISIKVSRLVPVLHISQSQSTVSTPPNAHPRCSCYHMLILPAPATPCSSSCLCCRSSSSPPMLILLPHLASTRGRF